MKLLSTLVRLAALATAAAILVSPAPAASPSDPRPPRDPVEIRGDAYYHLMQAMFVARRGQIEEAAREVRAAVALEPSSAPLKAEAAALMVLFGRRDDAEGLARRALDLDPENARALEILAELVLNRAIGRSDESGVREALTLYERLSRTADPDPDVFQVIGRIRLQLGDPDGAAEAARALLARRPGEAGAARLLVQALRQASRPGEALDAAIAFLTSDAARAGDERDRRAMATIVVDLARQLDAWDAIGEHGADLVRAADDDAAIHALYGEALLREGRDGEAIGEFERSVALQSGEPMVRFQLATAYASVGRLADAANLAEQLAHEYPDHPGVLRLYGEVLAQQGYADRAIETLRSAIERLGSDPADSGVRDAMRLRIAGLDLARERPAAARDTLAALESPKTAEAVEMRVRVALASGDTNAARRALKGLASDDAHGMDLALEAEILAREGRIERARARYEDAAAVLGSAVRARAAEVFRDVGRPEVGEDVLRGWTGLEPGEAMPWFQLGAYLEREGRIAEAEPALRHAIEIDPRFAEALNYLAYTLAVEGRGLDEALDLANRALAIDPWNGAFLDTLGWVHYRAGRAQEAVAPLEKASQELPRDATVQDHLGDVYAKLGRNDAALAAWNRALEARAEDADRIREKIAALETAAAGERPPR